MIPRKEGERGVTLVGLVVAMAIGLIVVAAAFKIFSAQTRAQTTMRGVTSVLQDVRLVADPVVRELRMTGFGVDAGDAIELAGVHQIRLRGDVNDDVRVALAQPASQGDTEIYVHLDDAEPSVDSDDLIFLDGERREAVRVRQSGEPVNTVGEPDVIYLDAPLAYDHTAGTTSVHTVETVSYNYSSVDRTLTRSGDVVSFDVDDLTFRYFDEAGSELTPEVNGLLAERKLEAIRSFSANLSLSTTGGSGRVTKDFTVTVDLRNQGFLHYRNDHCPPQAPTGVQVTDDGTCRHFQVRWTPPSQNACDGSAVDDLEGFKVYFGTESGVYFKPAFTVSDGSAYEAWVYDARLEQGGTYYVAVTAVDSSYNESELSSETVFTLRDEQGPEPPAGLSAESGAGTVTLRWEKSDAIDAEGYRIYRGEDPDFTPGESNRVADKETLDADTVEFTDTNRTPCVTYYYYVTTEDCAQEGELSDSIHGDGDGSEADEPDNGDTDTTPEEETPTPPAAPAPFTASAGDSEVELNWVAPSDEDLERIVIRFSTGGYPSSSTAGSGLIDEEATAGSAGTYEHADLVNGFTYYYSAFAIDRCSNVSEAAEAEATPSAGDGPRVRISSPYSGQTIRDGEFSIQAQAYDEGAADVSDPPDFDADDGKGIARVDIDSAPDRFPDFPQTDYTQPYCGFGDAGSACRTDDAEAMCEGIYYLWADATSTGGETATSPFVYIYIDSGGLELDPTYVPRAAGSNNSDVYFQQINTCDELRVRYLSVTVAWDVFDARLAGYGTSSDPYYKDYRDGSTPLLTTGSTIDDLDSMRLDPDETFQEQLHFAYPYTTLSQKFKAGRTSFSVYDADGFSVGDTVYFNDQSAYPRQIVSISGTSVTIDSPLPFDVSKRSTLCSWPDVDGVDMSDATITLRYEYEKDGGSASCTSDVEIEIAANPYAGKVYQDKPQVDTVALTVAGQIVVKNGDAVPVHVKITDWSGVGMDNVALYYVSDDDGSTSAPESGYMSTSMAWDTADERYEATIPGNEDTRIWYYVVATDREEGERHLPETGAYTYDCEDVEPPACPSNLTAQAHGNNRVDLSWSAGGALVVSYNIYRKADCGEYALLARGVTDGDSGEGVQYNDRSSDLDLNRHCYAYYVTAVDIYGNESAGCETNEATAGDECPAECSGGDDDDDIGYFFVPDRSRRKVYRYRQTGQNAGVISMSRSNGDARGAASDGDYVYVLDGSDQMVYRYRTHGASGAAVSRRLRGTGGGTLGHMEGLAISGDDLWAVNRDDRGIYRFSLSAAFSGSGNVNAEHVVWGDADNADARGLAVYQGNLYVLDRQDRVLYRYPTGGSSGGDDDTGDDDDGHHGGPHGPGHGPGGHWRGHDRGYRGGQDGGGGDDDGGSGTGDESAVSRRMNRPNGGDLSDLRGVTIGNASAWVVDRSRKVIAKFGLSDLFQGGGSIDAESEFNLNRSQQEPEGL